MGLARYLNPDCNPARITKAGKDYVKNHDFKDITFPVKVSEIQKLKKRIQSALMVLLMKINKNIQSMYHKTLWKGTWWVIINKRKTKKTLCSYQRFWYILYNHTLHRRK